MVFVTVTSSIGHASEENKSKTFQSKVRKTHIEYALQMSEDDAICQPILAEYNKNISLDFGEKPFPRPYPWPSPSPLALHWKKKSWVGLPGNMEVDRNTYTIAEADLNHDGQNEIVMRWASWARSDDRFTSLEVFPQKTEIPRRIEEYKAIFLRDSIARVVPGGYDFPKLNGKVGPTELNDFDVIQFKGKQYVTGKTVIMNGIVEELNVPRWRIVSRVRFGKPPISVASSLDWTLDSICYFRLKTNK